VTGAGAPRPQRAGAARTSRASAEAGGSSPPAATPGSA